MFSWLKKLWDFLFGKPAELPAPPAECGGPCTHDASKAQVWTYDPHPTYAIEEKTTVTSKPKPKKKVMKKAPPKGKPNKTKGKRPKAKAIHDTTHQPK